MSRPLALLVTALLFGLPCACRIGEGRPYDEFLADIDMASTPGDMGEEDSGDEMSDATSDAPPQ